jgi:hypothetical protein
MSDRAAANNDDGEGVVCMGEYRVSRMMGVEDNMWAFSVSMGDGSPSGICCSLDPDGEEEGKNGRLERSVIGIGAGDVAKSAWLVGNSSGGGHVMASCNFDL